MVTNRTAQENAGTDLLCNVYPHWKPTLREWGRDCIVTVLERALDYLGPRIKALTSAGVLTEAHVAEFLGRDRDMGLQTPVAPFPIGMEWLAVANGLPLYPDSRPCGDGEEAWLNDGTRVILSRYVAPGGFQQALLSLLQWGRRHPAVTLHYGLDVDAHVFVEAIDQMLHRKALEEAAQVTGDTPPALAPPERCHCCWRPATQGRYCSPECANHQQQNSQHAIADGYEAALGRKGAFPTITDIVVCIKEAAECNPNANQGSETAVRVWVKRTGAVVQKKRDISRSSAA